MEQSKINRWVEVSLQRDLVHGDKNVEVPIGQRHRHRVTFSVRVNVHHADREIEYFALRKFCMELWSGDTHQVGDASLEWIGLRPNRKAAGANQRLSQQHIAGLPFWFASGLLWLRFYRLLQRIIQLSGQNC